MFETAKDARAAGWFSRRHETEEAHAASTMTARERKAQRRREAETRAEARALRTDEEQIEILRQRGSIASRERTRLIERNMKNGGK